MSTSRIRGVFRPPQEYMNVRPFYLCVFFSFVFLCVVLDWIGLFFLLWARNQQHPSTLDYLDCLFCVRTHFPTSSHLISLTHFFLLHMTTCNCDFDCNCDCDRFPLCTIVPSKITFVAWCETYFEVEEYSRQVWCPMCMDP